MPERPTLLRLSGPARKQRTQTVQDLSLPTAASAGWKGRWWAAIQKGVLFGIMAMLAGIPSTLTAELPTVGTVPPALRREFKLAPFYGKCVQVGALPIVGSTNVSDFAMREAAWIASRMLEGREDILNALASNRVRLVVMAWSEFTTDVPEHSHLKPKVYWDRRARGLGATPRAPAVSCGEENLLAFPGDPYPTENILIHEFAHAVHETALRTLDPSFNQRLNQAFQAAKTRSLWKGTYAGTGPAEYWAEGVQDWFDNNRENDSLHNHVNTRGELRAYDPELAKLCEEIFGNRAWRYRKPANRSEADRAHLAGFDPAQSHRFKWRSTPVTDEPRVLIQTEIGEIEIELDSRRAPITTTNFLRYVLEGFYSDGAFHRTVTLDNQPTNNIKVQVIQAAANAAKETEALPPIPLERTRDTGMRHRDGTVSMARAEPDSAQHHFFICIGDQPELDFGGQRNPDGQGFAAFGRVIKGMPVVHAIHRSRAEGQQLTPAVRIQRAIRVH